MVTDRSEIIAENESFEGQTIACKQQRAKHLAAMNLAAIRDMATLGPKNQAKGMLLSKENTGISTDG